LISSCCIPRFSSLLYFNDTSTTHFYTLSLHDALPIYISYWLPCSSYTFQFQSYVLTLEKISQGALCVGNIENTQANHGSVVRVRSEEHTSELQSRFDLVCRLLLEKKYIISNYNIDYNY